MLYVDDFLAIRDRIEKEEVVITNKHFGENPLRSYLLNELDISIEQMNHQLGIGHGNFQKIINGKTRVTEDLYRSVCLKLFTKFDQMLAFADHASFVGTNGKSPKWYTNSLTRCIIYSRCPFVYSYKAPDELGYFTCSMFSKYLTHWLMENKPEITFLDLADTLKVSPSLLWDYLTCNRPMPKKVQIRLSKSHVFHFNQEERTFILKYYNQHLIDTLDKLTLKPDSISLQELIDYGNKPFCLLLNKLMTKEYFTIDILKEILATSEFKLKESCLGKKKYLRDWFKILIKKYPELSGRYQKYFKEALDTPKKH